jgi:hypothetical protein
MSSAFQDNVRLNVALAHYESCALSPATKAVYMSGARAFLTFANMYNLQKGDAGLPRCDENLLRYFVCHCAENFHLSYVTIKSYLSSVRNLYIVNGLPNPLVHPVTGEPLHRLALLCRGIKKSHSPAANSRKPLSGTMLRTICQHLRKGVMGYYLDSLLESACLIAFFGFLRCGEFTTPTQNFDPNVNLCLGDITLTSTCANVLLKVSKTDPFRTGCMIMLFKNNTLLCPYASLVRFLSFRRSLGSDPRSPLFLLPGGQPMSRKSFIDMLQHVCRAAQIDVTNISGHSLRIGAATEAANARTPDHLIQTLGRWSSTCYTRYIRTPKSLIMQAQSDIAKNMLVSRAVSRQACRGSPI